MTAFWNKAGPGTYRFTIGSGGDARTYVASRNEAGFAHRNWDVHLVVVAGENRVADQLPTRDACAHEAYRHWSRTVRQPGLMEARKKT